MQTTISHKFLVPIIACTAVAGLYLANTGVAEASTRSSIQNRSTLSTNASSTASSTRPRAVDATCMSQAVETREEALTTAWDDLNVAIKAGLTDRKVALVAAWSMTNTTDRNKALKAAWAAWRADKKEAHAEFKADRTAAWNAFKATVKSECKVSLPKDEAMDKAAKDSVAI